MSKYSKLIASIAGVAPMLLNVVLGIGPEQAQSYVTLFTAVATPLLVFFFPANS